jgi:hypothetical protein
MIQTPLHSPGNKRIKSADADTSGYIKLHIFFLLLLFLLLLITAKLLNLHGFTRPIYITFAILVPQSQTGKHINLPQLLLLLLLLQRGLYTSLRTASSEIDIPLLSQTPFPSPKTTSLLYLQPPLTPRPPDPPPLLPVTISLLTQTQEITPLLSLTSKSTRQNPFGLLDIREPSLSLFS